MEILRHVVDMYVASGVPVPSKSVADRLETLSSATIRNIMAELQQAGLIYSPHTSAGRVPTEAGLRVFVDALLEVGALSEDERHNIERTCTTAGKDMKTVLDEATKALSGLSQCASLVIAPKAEKILKHIEFVSLSDNKGLVITVSEDGNVENRLITLPAGLPPSSLREATNYLNARMGGKTLSEVKRDILDEIKTERAQLNKISSSLVETGLAVWSGDATTSNTLIIHGHSKLLEDVTRLEDLEHVRKLLNKLEVKNNWIDLIEQARIADGVRIFIGAENELFGLTGCSMVVAPFTDTNKKVVGALGVIGPTRINYGRIVPMVDYTAKVIGKLLA